MSDGDTRKRRATNVDVAQNKSAMAIVRAFRPPIVRIQHRAAVLAALAAGFAQRHDSESLNAEAEALLAEVEAHSVSLSESIATLPPEIRNHGRVVDTVKALRSVHQVLERACFDFSKPSPRHTSSLMPQIGNRF